MKAGLILKLELLGDVTVQALRLEPDAFRLVESLPGVALTVVFLAGISVALGQAAVLFINRVKLGRFLGSLLVSALHYVFAYGFWTLSIFFLGHVLFASEASIGSVARAVGLGYAPQLFSFLVFMPYFGMPVFVLLTLWSLLAIVIGISVSMGLLLWQALLLSALGWLVLQLSKRSIGRPLIALARRSRRRVSGVELVTDMRQLELKIEAKMLVLPIEASKQLVLKAADKKKRVD